MKFTSRERKKRALRYALSLVVFQEVGAGDDDDLSEVRSIVNKVRALCHKETGVMLESYPTEYLGKHITEIIDLLPYKIKNVLKIIKGRNENVKENKK